MIRNIFLWLMLLTIPALATYEVEDNLYVRDNVGIGTTATTALLTVKGNGSLTGTVTIGTATVSNTLTVATNVGIGTTIPRARIDTVGVGTTTGSNMILRNSSKVALMTVLDSGNVGIGSATPSATLDVVGTVKATSFSSTGNKTWQQVYSSTLSAHATSVSITGLSGDTDLMYRIIVKPIGDNAGGTQFGLQFNTDSGAHYSWSALYGSGGGAAYTTSNGQTFYKMCSTTGASQVALADTVIYAKSGYARTLFTSATSNNTATTSAATLVFSGVWSNTANAITSIQVIADQVNGLGVGTSIELQTYR